MDKECLARVDVAFLRDLFGLDGRVAIVTGASGGIGAELARGLARAGASVLVTGRDAARLGALADDIHANGGQAAQVVADLGQIGAIEPIVAAARARFGGVDVLVNCAGMNRRETILDVTPETYQKIMDVNLRSAYFLSQAVVPILAERGGGKIIHIGSINAAIGLEAVSVYGLSKSALAQTTKVMAIEWAHKNIQVNCLCPGFIETELTGPLWQDPRRRDWILDRLPTKRPGRPRDLIGMAIYLAAPASNYTTGQTFFVDGGFLAGSPWS